MLDDYKHYIRVDADGFIIKTFSTAFEQPQDGDICINQSTEERHFNFDLIEPGKSLKYKYDAGQIREATEAEQEAWRAAQPPQPPTQAERIEALEAAMLALMEV